MQGPGTLYQYILATKTLSSLYDYFWRQRKNLSNSSDKLKGISSLFNDAAQYNLLEWQLV